MKDENKCEKYKITERIKKQLRKSKSDTGNYVKKFNK